MKKFMILATAALLGSAVNASYLYWQVDSADYTDSTSWNAARIYAVDSSGTATVLNSYDSEDDSTYAVAMADTGANAVNLSQLSNASSYSFYIELVN